MAFYRMVSDLAIPNRWYLGTPETPDGLEVDPREFNEGVPVRVNGRMCISQRRVGDALDFTLADFDMPVVHERCGKLLQQIAPKDIQLFDVDVQGVRESFGILNVTRKARCIDEGRSQIVRWEASDNRPDKIGQYRMVTRLTIDPSKVAADTHLLRIDGWEQALIASEMVKVAFEKQKVKGVKFVAVST